MAKKLENQSTTELIATKKKLLTIYKVVAILFFISLITLLYLISSKTIAFQFPLISTIFIFVAALIPSVAQIKAIEKELEKRKNT